MESAAVLREKVSALKENLKRVIRGKDAALDLLMTALLARGSVLMEDVPGVGKTTLAKALAKSIDGQFNRVQFTPDLLPADILGTSIYNPVQGTFDFRPGPVFCNILLSDEINRASPRTQSALLEAMSEGQASIEGVCRPLPKPFLVLATQNPVEYHGTYPLPEAQLDRFLCQLEVGYPDADTEVEMLHALSGEHPVDTVTPVMTVEEVGQLQQAVSRVTVDTSLARYIVDIIGATRLDSRIKLGASPRASLMLYRAAQARAFILGRDFVLPDDIQAMVIPVLAHRLMLTSKAKYGGAMKRDLLQEILRQVAVPA